MHNLRAAEHRVVGSQVNGSRERLACAVNGPRPSRADGHRGETWNQCGVTESAIELTASVPSARVLDLKNHASPRMGGPQRGRPHEQDDACVLIAALA
jgi:hypothetical protein